MKLEMHLCAQKDEEKGLKTEGKNQKFVFFNTL